MLNVKIFDMVNLYLESDAEKLSFVSSDFGCITVEEFHENMTFNINVCKLVLVVGSNIKTFFAGYGFVKIEDNFVVVFGCPVCDSLELFRVKCAKLDEYGEKCLSSIEQYIEIYE